VGIFPSETKYFSLWEFRAVVTACLRYVGSGAEYRSRRVWDSGPPR
jgi:hypothetical protein